MTNSVIKAAEAIGATPADIAGLWNAPGYPELTTGQLLSIAAKNECSGQFRLQVSPLITP